MIIVLKKKLLKKKQDQLTCFISFFQNNHTVTVGYHGKSSLAKFSKVDNLIF